MSDKAVITLLGLCLPFLAGCGEGETEAERQARQLQARADSVMMAESQYDASVFDTLTWETPGARHERGGVVWRASCQKCHGRNGDGSGEYAQQLQLVVPSFLAADWPYAGDVATIRHRIFVGHERGMPNWGLHGLKYRDIDAVAGFIVAAMAPGREAAND